MSSTAPETKAPEMVTVKLDRLQIVGVTAYHKGLQSVPVAVRDELQRRGRLLPLEAPTEPAAGDTDTNPSQAA